LVSEESKAITTVTMTCLKMVETTRLEHGGQLDERIQVLSSGIARFHSRQLETVARISQVNEQLKVQI
jgi:hypothetical protein